jgi:hypothetical protein
VALLVVDEKNYSNTKNKRGCMFSIYFILIFKITMILYTPTISAHLMSSGKGTINIKGKLAYIVVSLPSEAFLEQNIDKKKYQFQKKILIFGDGIKATWLETFVSYPLKYSKHKHHKKSDIVFMGIAKFYSKPKVVTFKSSLWNDRLTSLQIETVRTNSNGQKEKDTRIITKNLPSVDFFLPTLMRFKNLLKISIKKIFNLLFF